MKTTNETLTELQTMYPNCSKYKMNDNNDRLLVLDENSNLIDALEISQGTYYNFFKNTIEKYWVKIEL
jgi:hypothetical protein